MKIKSRTIYVTKFMASGEGIFAAYPNTESDDLAWKAPKEDPNADLLFTVLGIFEEVSDDNGISIEIDRDQLLTALDILRKRTFPRSVLEETRFVGQMIELLFQSGQKSVLMIV